MAGRLDTFPPPPSLRVERFEWPDDTRIDRERYTSPAFAALEAEHL